MKRAGGLWAGVLTRDNLLRAFRQAARGKRGKWEVRRFEEDLDRQLDQLRAEVVAGSFEVGRCHVFKVFEPKERLEQQQPGQPEQQHRLPPGPQLSPVEPIGTSPRGTEPAAVRTVGAGQRQTTAPSRGAGRVSGRRPTRTPHATPGAAPAAAVARSWSEHLI